MILILKTRRDNFGLIEVHIGKVPVATLILHEATKDTYIYRIEFADGSPTHFIGTEDECLQWIIKALQLGT